MKLEMPRVTREYKNHHLDSTRWDVYEPRDGDIVVTTSYKSGTTWAQQILYWLTLGDPRDGPEMREVSPWVDARFMGTSKQQLSTLLEGLPGRRFVKSHLPLDGLPYHPQVRYLIVGRDPRDVFMSLLNHYASYTETALALLNNPDGRVGGPLPGFPEDAHALWRDWMTRGWFEWESEGYPFWANMGHTESYWKHRHLPNFLFLHYADMLRELEDAVRQIAEFVDLDVSDERIARTVENTTFGAVKKRADEMPAEQDGARMIFEGGAGRFFFKGTNGRWRELLSDGDLELYEKAKARVLSPDCAEWLEQGGPVEGR
jgi:aryl sulfotransferase